MEAVLFQIVRALATVFEITLAFALLNAMFEPKYASKWPLRLSYILLLAAVFSSSARLTVISVKTAVEILLRISRLPVGFPRPVEHQGFL